MDDADRITELEGKIGDLEEQLLVLRRELGEAEMDRWRGRIDDLEVQARLGSMDVRDRLAPLVEELRNTWLSAKESFSDASSTTSEVFERIRDGLNNARDEIRGALDDAKSTIKS